MARPHFKIDCLFFREFSVRIKHHVYTFFLNFFKANRKPDEMSKG